MNDVFKELVFDIIAREVIKRLIASIPILSFGPVGFVVTELLLKFAKMFYDTQKELLIFYKFQFVNEINQKAFDKEFQKLTTVNNDPNATPEQKQKALEDAKTKMAFLVRHSISKQLH
jgi:hypothetical protein